MNASFEIPQPTFTVPSISSSAVLIELNISTWSGRKQDKNVAKKAERDTNAQSGALSVYKSLLGDCTALKAVTDYAAAIRSYYISVTMPWSEKKGPRLLVTSMYAEVNRKLEEMQVEFERLVTAFIDEEYAPARANAFRVLGDAYNPGEYPSTFDLRQKFSMRFITTLVPEVSDNWVLNLQDEAVAQMKARYSEYYTEKVKGAMADVARRLVEEIQRFTNQLRVEEDGKKGRLFQSTIDHVLSLCDMADQTNFTNDTRVTQIAASVRALLDGTEAAEIKKNDADRAEMHRKMQEIVDAIPSMGF